MKPYHIISKNGTEYVFNSYLEFASFWFNLKRSYAIKNFPEFAKLQKMAANSKEAKTKL